MADTDTSYSATGPTAVAFETTSTSVPVDQLFGAMYALAAVVGAEGSKEMHARCVVSILGRLVR
jgi:hypothetical protein